MLFKGQDLPPPRHLLDDAADESVDIEVEHSLHVDATEIAAARAEIETLLVLAPRVVRLGFEISGRSIATFKVKTTQRTALDGYVNLEGDEEEANIDEQVQEHSLQLFRSTSSGIPNLGILPLPLVPDASAGFLAKHVLGEFKDSIKALWVVTPGTMYGSHLGAVYSTKAAKNNVLNEVGSCIPPTIVQGIAAAFLSRAEFLGLSATGLVVNADGPAGYEMINSYDADLLKKLVFKLAKLRHITTEALDLSTLYV